MSAEEILGRNTWNLWTAGNEHFWDRATRDSFGSWISSRCSITVNFRAVNVSRLSD